MRSFTYSIQSKMTLVEMKDLNHFYAPHNILNFYEAMKLLQNFKLNFIAIWSKGVASPDDSQNVLYTSLWWQ